MENWYFDTRSRVYGSETFGPYDSEAEAKEGIKRVREAAKALKDDITRIFSQPYQK